MALYVFHPGSTSAYPELQADLDALDELSIPHGSLLPEIPAGSLVVPRFRMIPFGRELEDEVTLLGSRLINSYREHRNIANLYNWVHLLVGLTPPAYGLEDIPRLPEGEYFLKGETNSKKSDWFGSAYAPNKASLLKIAHSVLSDQYVGSQQLAIRPFQKYREIGKAVNGRPIFHERRAFYYRGELLTEAHYWNVDDFGAPEPLNPPSYARTQELAKLAVGELADFLVIDYAEYEDGSWGVVELNDASMAGLSANSALDLWGRLRNIVR